MYEVRLMWQSWKIQVGGDVYLNCAYNEKRIQHQVLCQFKSLQAPYCGFSSVQNFKYLDPNFVVFQVLKGKNRDNIWNSIIIDPRCECFVFGMIFNNQVDNYLSLY